MMLVLHSRFMLIVMAIVVGGCTTIQRTAKFIDPMKTNTNETRTVSESGGTSSGESTSSEALPAVDQIEQETTETETTEQATTAEDIGKVVLTTLAVLLVVTTVAANIAFIAAVSH